MPGSRVRPFLNEFRGRAGWVVLGALVCQLALGVHYIFGALQKDIVADLGWTRTMFSSARGPLFAVIALTTPIVGAMSVRFGARPILTVCTILLGVSMTIASRMTDLWGYYLSNLIVGVTIAGLGDVVVGAVVAQHIARARGLALGIVYSGSNIAGWICVPLVAWLATELGWRSAVLVLGLGATALILPFAAFAVGEPETARAQGRDAAEDQSLDSGRERDVDLSEAARTRTFWILAFVLFCFFFYFIAMLDHTVAYLTDVGFSKAEAAAAFGTAIGLGMVSKLAGGAIADRISPRTGIIVDFALVALSSVLVSFVLHRGVLPIFLLTYGFSVAARDVVYPLAVAHYFGVRYLAKIYGALSLAMLPGGVLGPLFAAYVFDRLGSYRPAFAVFAILNLTALASLFLLRDERDAMARG
jgi:predicted MFS family arabinose efflux permease